MGIFGKIFTWWNGATIGTALHTMLRGRNVGEDADGNRYFEGRDGRRWVIYAGSNDASNVPAEWHGWLHRTHDALPADSLPPIRPWQLPASPNLTGTTAAYRPAGALERGGRRAAATGDYQAWTPEG